MEIREKVLEVLKAVNPKISGYETENLIEQGLIDSFEIVNIVLELEDAFDIFIDPELVLPENFETVCSIAKIIESIAGKEA